MATRNGNFLVYIILLLACCSPIWAQQSHLPGQSSTLLPDGHSLLAGGFGANGVPTQEAFLVSTDGVPTKLGTTMNVARAGHSATVLPDGTVLIFGGAGTDGQLVADAELFDPASQQFSLLPDVFAVPRTFHTATVLTDGSVLFAGGVLAGGQFPDDVQLWDFQTRKALSQHALLMTPREGQSAELLSDGSVRISGGTDHFGKPVIVNEIFDPVTKRFRYSTASTVSADADAQAPLRIAASIPEDGAQNVPIQMLIAVRFSRNLNVISVNNDTFKLVGPDGSTVTASVTPAERGRLAFILPAAPLQSGSSYILRMKGAADPTGNPLPETSITFQTEGAPPDAADPDFIPGPGWTSGTGGSKWQELPALQAAPGTTALAGQVLKLNGWPLEHVTLEMDGKKAHTDATGRFLLKGLTAGHHVLWIDATTANHTNATYGVYEVGVTVLGNKTNVLNYTIWMTRLDMAHAISIPSPTTQETVLTNPAMPGLELHIPPNTTITDRTGKIVRQVTITPVPLDKPPFPLPAGVNVPLYFTVQPGGAYIKVGYSKDGPKGARLIYPNAFNLKPGSPFDFWNYDADAKGWYIYGNGHVSDDGKSVIPDPGVVIYEFTGAMVGGSTGAPGKGKPKGSKSKAADPVDLSTGEFIYTKTDLVLPDTIPIGFTRTYITNDSRSRAFGIGATDSYDFFMVGDTFPYTFQELIQPDGGRVRFDRISAGTSYTDAVYVAASASGEFYGAVLSWNSDTSLPGSWKIEMKDGTILSFPESFGSTDPFCQAVIQIKDRYGNTTKIDRTNCRLSKITSPNGRYITVTNDTQSRITQITDNAGRSVNYTYDAGGRLATATDPNGGVTAYTYDDQNRMLTIRDPRNIVYLTNEYDGGGRVSKQTQADGGVYLFNWTPAQSSQTHFIAQMGTGTGGGPMMLIRDACWGGGGYKRYDPNCASGYLPLVAQVDVTDPRGYVRRVVFGQTGYSTSDTHALGQPEEQTVTYSYYADNLLQSVTDSLGRVTSFDYDSQGNATRITRLDGTPNAVTNTLSYGGPFGQLSSVTNSLGLITTYSYDALGHLTTMTDPMGHQTVATYDSGGRIVTVTDPANQTSQFGYFGGDLTTKIGPLGNTTTEFHDAVGRITTTVDPLGQRTQLQYDVLNLVQQLTDPKGNISSYTYDANGNPLSITDANGHTTSYSYDNMDRRITRTDALLRTESSTYDLSGNLSTVTDRKGQITAFTYDALNRLISTCFKQTVNAGLTNCESTLSTQYDLPNRRLITTDSLGGIITRTFDDMGRLLSEDSPQSSVSYVYDIGGRLTKKTVAGQVPFTYTYNNVGQVLTATQGSRSAQITYDSGGRPIAMAFPNGIVATYTYDNSSRLTEISYSQNHAVIGNLTYSYDPLNRRIGTGGSLAATVLPTSLASATYDAANQISNWNGVAFAYDADGNLINDGQSTYTWNARGQLTGLVGPVNASFAYDGFGRRIDKVIGSTNTNFVYDGGGIAREFNGSTVTADVWSAGANGFVERTDAGGVLTPLADAQGSVIGLADPTGSVVTSYSYDPFGGTVASGAASGNATQYIGRENDLNGLYYLHARYYSPAMGRFISEDPLGFAGGDVNLHAYTLGSPTNLTDPSGTVAPIVAGCLFGAVTDASLNLYADYYTGRKSDWTDVFSFATLRYAATGCVWGATFGAFGQVVTAAAEAVFPMSAAGIISGEMGAAAGGAAGGEAGPAAEGLTSLDADSIRFSQTSINDAASVTDSMEANGWVGDPVDVVRMPDGGLTTVDNTRVFAAGEANIDVQAVVHEAADSLPAEQAGRFLGPNGSVPTTWGEAVANRIANQNRLFGSTYPMGSPYIGVQW